MEFKEYEKRFNETEDLKLKLKIANEICEEYSNQERDQQVFPYYQFISTNAHYPDTELLRAKALFWLGNYYYLNSSFDLGLETLFEVRELFIELKEEEFWINTMNIIAVIYNALGQKEKAVQIYEEIFKVKDDELKVMQNYADLLIDKGEYAKAYKLLDKAIKIVVKRQDLVAQIDLLSSLSNYYIQIKETEKALLIFEKHKLLIEEKRVLRSSCFHYINYAEALTILGRSEEALVSLKKAIEIAEESQKPELLFFSYKTAIDIYESIQDYQQSNYCLKKFMEIKDKIYNFKINEKTEALEARMQKERLLTESQEIVEKAKHMASLGIMASGITHEINQPLNAIMIDAQTLIYKDDIEKVLPESYRQRIQYIIEATERISNIIKHIRSYWINNDWIDKKEFEVNQTITKAVALVNQQVKAHGIILKVRLSPSSVFVFGTPISLEQTIINLVVNSIHALDNFNQKQKIITLTTIVKGNIVNIYIQDNGPGVSEHIAHRIFEPFFTQKDKDLGSGLGLTLVQNFVKDLNGTISLFDEKKKGAHFVVKIPIVDR